MGPPIAERVSAAPPGWVSASVLVMAGSLAVGVFQCWSPALPTQLEGVLPNGLLKWRPGSMDAATFFLGSGFA